MRGFLYNRWNVFLHELPIYEAVLHEQINGEDSVELTVDRPLSKGDRILFNDAGKWREYVYDQGTQRHEAGETYSIICDNSFMWDFSQRIIRYTRWENKTCSYAVGEIAKLLPLWSVGTVMSTPQKILEYSEETAYKALLETAGAFGCEISYDITVDKNGVTKRTLNFVERVGKDTEIRFDYGNGLYGVEKTTLPDKVVTAVYGIGSTVNDTELWCYETNDDLLRYWGLPAGDGQVIHSEDIFSNPDIETQAELKAEARKYLDAHSAPSISYTTQIPFVSLAGARLGDTVSVVDKDFTPPLRLRTRIGQMDRNLITGEVTSAVFGTVISLLPDALARSIQREKIIVKQTGVIGGLRSDLKNTQGSLSSALGSLSTAQSNITSLQTELGQTKRDLTTAQDALKYAQQDLKTAQDDAAAAKKQANDLAAVVTAQGQTITSQGKQITDLNSKYNEIHDLWLQQGLTTGNAYTASRLIGNIWLKAKRGQDVTLADVQTSKNCIEGYNEAVSRGASRNEAVEQMYNEVLDYYNQTHSDTPLPGPSIEEE